MRIDPLNHYWIVGSHPGEFYSSAANVYVSPDNEDFVSWTRSGGETSTVATEAELADLIRPYRMDMPEWLFSGDRDFIQPAVGEHSKPQLARYLAAKRYGVEVGGVLIDGNLIATDLASQSKVSGALLLSIVNPAVSVEFKVGDGFVTLDAAGIKNLALKVGEHVQKCFARESSAREMIENGQIKTVADVDERF